MHTATVRSLLFLLTSTLPQTCPIYSLPSSQKCPFQKCKHDPSLQKTAPSKTNTQTTPFNSFLITFTIKSRVVTIVSLIPHHFPSCLCSNHTGLVFKSSMLLSYSLSSCSSTLGPLFLWLSLWLAFSFPPYLYSNVGSSKTPAWTTLFKIADPINSVFSSPLFLFTTLVSI